MPDAKNNAKLTGDTHPPEVEDVGRAREGTPGAANARGTADSADQAGGKLERDLENEGRPGKGVNQAGFLKDKDGAQGGGKS